MKCILVAAISRDEYLTNGSDPQPLHWTSREDHVFFAKIRAEHHLFVMGETTYRHGKAQPTAGRLQVVLTHRPEAFSDEAVASQLEFHDLSPLQFVEKYAGMHDSCLILGGGRVYAAFERAGLIDEMYITIEPLTFGAGVHLFNHEFTLADLDLPEPETTQLNRTGTLLRHYART